MAGKEIHHIQLHQSRSMMSFLWLIILVFGGGYGYFFYKMGAKLEEPEPPAYSLDLRNEGAPVEIDYVNRWHVVVKVKRPEGDEVRFYDPNNGELDGTYLLPASAEAASSDEESGAE